MTDTKDRSLARACQMALVAASAVLAWSASASAGSSINTGYFGGVAIEGYDSVAYFTVANAEHRDLFAEKPVQYAPQYGGHCALGTAFGESTSNIDPEAWTIVNGKLYIQYSKGARENWEKDRPNLIAAADQKWPEVAARMESESGG
jgi:hypothetical protein